MNNHPLLLKKLSFLLILLLYCSLAFSQKQSKIYNKKGQLLADTLYRISKFQLKRFISLEDTLVSQLLDTVYSFKLNYPEMELENYIQDSITVVSFKIRNDSIKFQSIIPAFSDYGQRNFLERAFAKQIIMKLKQVKVITHFKYTDTSLYYIAFGWRLVDYKIKEIKEGVFLENGVIAVIRRKVPILPPIIHQEQTIDRSDTQY